MRLPNVENFQNTNIYNTMDIKNLDNDITRDYIIFNEKDKIKLIKGIVNTVRCSTEYKEYIKFLKDVLDMTKCSFYNMDSKNSKRKLSIEIHHEPFTLYDIAYIVLNRHIEEENSIKPLRIAEEVMKLHYQNRVGLVPLSFTVHELVHEGKVLVPLQFVKGDYLNFIEMYDKYVDEEMRSVLKRKIELSKELQDTTILQKKYVYVNIDGFELPQKI